MGANVDGAWQRGGHAVRARQLRKRQGAHRQTTACIPYHPVRCALSRPSRVTPWGHTAGSLVLVSLILCVCVAMVDGLISMGDKVCTHMLCQTMISSPLLSQACAPVKLARPKGEMLAAWKCFDAIPGFDALR